MKFPTTYSRHALSLSGRFGLQSGSVISEVVLVVVIISGEVGDP